MYEKEKHFYFILQQIIYWNLFCLYVRKLKYASTIYRNKGKTEKRKNIITEIHNRLYLLICFVFLATPYLSHIQYLKSCEKLFNEGYAKFLSRFLALATSRKYSKFFYKWSTAIWAVQELSRKSGARVLDLDFSSFFLFVKKIYF